MVGWSHLKVQNADVTMELGVEYCDDDYFADDLFVLGSVIQICAFRGTLFQIEHHLRHFRSGEVCAESDEL